MTICIAGKNEIAVNSLIYILNAKILPKSNLLICVNKDDKGIDGWQPSLKKKGSELGIVNCQLSDLYSIKDLIFISLEFDTIINPDKFASDKLFNLHFSLLPQYKGVYTSFFPVFNGDSHSGVTLHLIDKGIDTGDIIAQSSFAIDIQDTCRDLYFKYQKYGFELFKQNIISLIQNKYSSNIQHNIGSTYNNKHSVNFSNIKINTNTTSFVIHNQIRACIFEEYQLPYFNNHYIIKSNLTSEKIEKNYYKDIGDKIIISGMDGYKIILDKK